MIFAEAVSSITCEIQVILNSENHHLHDVLEAQGNIRVPAYNQVLFLTTSYLGIFAVKFIKSCIN